MAKYDMKVDVNLRYFFVGFMHVGSLSLTHLLISSVNMNVVQPSEQDICFISTRELGPSDDQDLLSMVYTRIQKESPKFLTLYEGIDQNVDIKMSTLVFRAAPEPVLALYDFIMTTFVPNSDHPIPSNPDYPPKDVGRLETSSDVDGKIRVLVKLEGVQGMFFYNCNIGVQFMVKMQSF